MRSSTIDSVLATLTHPGPIRRPARTSSPSRMQLVRFEPGVRFPLHRHERPEFLGMRRVTGG